MRIEVDYGPWESDTNRYNELGRVYRFKNLGGPDTETRIDLRCRLSIEGKGWLSRKRISHFVYLVYEPYMLEHERVCAAFFGPDDDLPNYKALPVKVDTPSGGPSFIVFDEKEGDYLLGVLLLGRLLTLNLLMTNGQSAGRIMLPNDSGFRAEYERFKSTLLR